MSTTSNSYFQNNVIKLTLRHLTKFLNTKVPAYGYAVVGSKAYMNIVAKCLQCAYYDVYHKRQTTDNPKLANIKPNDVDIVLFNKDNNKVTPYVFKQLTERILSLLNLAHVELFSYLGIENGKNGNYKVKYREFIDGDNKNVVADICDLLDNEKIILNIGVNNYSLEKTKDTKSMDLELDCNTFCIDPSDVYYDNYISYIGLKNILNNINRIYTTIHAFRRDSKKMDTTTDRLNFILQAWKHNKLNYTFITGLYGKEKNNSNVLNYKKKCTETLSSLNTIINKSSWSINTNSENKSTSSSYEFLHTGSVVDIATLQLTYFNNLDGEVLTNYICSADKQIFRKHTTKQVTTQTDTILGEKLTRIQQLDKTTQSSELDTLLEEATEITELAESEKK